MFSELIPIDDWGLFPKGKRPAVISGPCSIESEEMTIATAKAIKALGVSVFRGGIWKPRTHPGTFEGVGEKGFPWLKRVQQEVGMAIATEVANAHHVETALRYGTDLLWIGARTTTNPFATQEIMEALKGTSVPLLIKNPINPDPELWIGALERAYNVGLRKLAIVHRGFSSYEKTNYRYAPYWQIPVEMMRKIPAIPCFCDPSHISGNREKIAGLSDMAMNLNFDGLMIETHIDPSSALSDAPQQITPDTLGKILVSLKRRSETIGDHKMMAQVEDMRAQIDMMDKDLVSLLASRMEIVKKIGKLKKEGEITILQMERWNKVLNNALSEAEKRGLDPNYISKLFNIIHTASIEKQADLDDLQ